MQHDWKSFRVDFKGYVLSDFIIEDFERSHPDDSWAGLERRAKFNRHDKGLMNQWLNLARQREQRSQAVIQRQIQAYMDRQLIDAMIGGTETRRAA